MNLANNGEQGFLLGDSGYLLRKYLQTPILNTMENTPQHKYYMKYVTARNTVERYIGVLKARFRCLLAARTLHYSPITAGEINACCILHNIANANNAPVPPLTPEEAYEEFLLQETEHESRADLQRFMEENPQNHQPHVNQDLIEGRALQQALVDRLWRDAQ